MAADAAAASPSGTMHTLSAETSQQCALKLSVKMRCDSLNSGVENDSRGSSFFLISSSCTAHLVCKDHQMHRCMW